MDKDLRAHILAVIKKLYAEHTYRDISMSMILEEAGISKGAFYWYFKSKEDAFEEAFQECYLKTVEAAHSFDRTGMDALTILKERELLILSCNQADPCTPRVIGNHLQYLREKGIEAYPYGDFRDDVEALVEQGFAEGVFADVPKSFVSRMIYLFNSQLSRYFEDYPECFEDEVQRKKIIDTLFSALEKRT